MSISTERVQVVRHPLVQHHLGRLRDESTSPSEFRSLVRNVVTLLAGAATADLEVREATAQTPVGTAAVHELSQRVALVPILRAGVGFVDPMLDLIPTAEVWHLGLYRDEKSAKPVEYYQKLPERDPVDVALILDPMLATGGSAMLALDVLQKWGVPKLNLVVLIAAPEGIAAVQSKFPDVNIVTAAIDECLNEQKFIVPGLGDAGDRLFNTLRC